MRIRRRGRLFSVNQTIDHEAARATEKRRVLV
jgi:hypothetical protein